MKVKHQFINFIEAVNVPLPLFKGDLFLISPLPSVQSVMQLLVYVKRS